MLYLSEHRSSIGRAFLLITGNDEFLGIFRGSFEYNNGTLVAPIEVLKNYGSIFNIKIAFLLSKNWLVSLFDTVCVNRYHPDATYVH